MFPFSRMPFDKKQIEAAIVNLEKQSSAELRVYIERKIPLTSSISEFGSERCKCLRYLKWRKP